MCVLGRSLPRGLVSAKVKWSAVELLWLACFRSRSLLPPPKPASQPDKITPFFSSSFFAFFFPFLVINSMQIDMRLLIRHMGFCKARRAGLR